MLVGIDGTFFRCISCGEDLEQKVNGVIKYIKVDKHTDLTKLMAKQKFTHFDLEINLQKTSMDVHTKVKQAQNYKRKLNTYKGQGR